MALTVLSLKNDRSVARRERTGSEFNALLCAAALSAFISLPFPLSSQSVVPSRNRNFETPRFLRTCGRLHDSMIIGEGTVLELSSLFRSLPLYHILYQREITYGERKREKEKEKKKRKKQKIKPVSQFVSS